MPDAVIIGAGYAGMSAAALLSHAGRKVVVLEESERVGGRAWSFRDEEGYLREYGAHSHRLAHKGFANEVFKRLGEEIDFLPESKDGKLIFRGRLWERPEGPIGFLKTPLLSIRARLVLPAFVPGFSAWTCRSGRASNPAPILHLPLPESIFPLGESCSRGTSTATRVSLSGRSKK